MNTYKDPSGVVFTFSPDLSGEVTIQVPVPGAKTLHTVKIPADAMGRFICNNFMDVDVAIEGLNRIKDWLLAHTDAITQHHVERLPGTQVQGGSCRTCEDMPDDCYPNPGFEDCDRYKPRSE